ncbi:hypothetical protein ROZALSC1DRAFT_20736 [Rozella allomycis CSF55]|uniref:Spindle pole body component n=1 Tax=Rozella allomycis (strain CSF55) TaxID=988480 RepID=A0A4P9YNK9_ROZAC|nr:hypothetical protein ROZALSC1DRAFT_20736 [Rozella allomycis CSF55]
MLHELLLCLTGFQGDILSLNSQNVFQISPIFAEHLHLSEKNLLESLSVVGSQYLKLRVFSSDNHNSLYISVFARWIKKKLYEYQADIVNVEKGILLGAAESNGQSTPLTFFKHYFSKYMMLFDTLVKLVEGGTLLRSFKLMDVIRQNFDIGINEYKNYYLEIQEMMLMVFLKQLIPWLAYGALKDPYNEFFIRKVDNISDPWDAFEVSEELSSNLISDSTLRKILFIGKASQIMNAKREVHSKLSIKLTPSENDDDFREITRLLQNIPDSGFNRLKFDSTIEMLRKKRSVTLFEVFEKEHHLSYCFKSFKSFYLLGNGDFYQTLIDNISKSDNDRTVNISFSWISSLQQSSALHERFSSFFSLEWKDESYFKAIVIETHFNELLQEFNNDFETVLSRHTMFLDSLLKKCFIDSPSIYPTLLQILMLIERYCFVLKQLNSKPNIEAILENREDPSLQMIETYFVDFKTNQSYILRTLQGVRGEQNLDDYELSTYFDTFLLIMDFNYFYTPQI